MLRKLRDHDNATVREPVECKHLWRYVGTDYHGSRKDENMYTCMKCRKIEYGVGDG